MWNKKVNNFICNYLDEYQVQKKHIERVLSAKEIINNKKPPYYPKFLKLKLCKLQMEEEKNNKIKEENKQLFYKIINAETKPSKYSRIFEPKICPSFNKDIICFQRIKKEIKNYQENLRFYNKIEKVKSYYDRKEMTKRRKSIDNNVKKLQKSILELQPSLLFLSPNRVKEEIKKYKNITYNISKTKRCNSCCYRETSKTSDNKKRGSSSILNKRKNSDKKQIKNNNKKNNDSVSSDSTLKKFSSLNEVLPEKKNEDIQEKNKIIEKNLNNFEETIKKINAQEEKNKSIKSNNNNINKKTNSSLDKKSVRNSEKNKKENLNEKEKKRKKIGLKRNTSEINIFK